MPSRVCGKAYGFNSGSLFVQRTLLGDGLGVGLRDDETHAVLGSAAVDGFRLPDVRVAPAGAGTGDNLHGIADFYILTHCRFPP